MLKLAGSCENRKVNRRRRTVLTTYGDSLIGLRIRCSKLHWEYMIYCYTIYVSVMLACDEKVILCRVSWFYLRGDWGGTRLKISETYNASPFSMEFWAEKRKRRIILNSWRCDGDEDGVDAGSGSNFAKFQKAASSNANTLAYSNNVASIQYSTCRVPVPYRYCDIKFGSFKD